MADFISGYLNQVNRSGVNPNSIANILSPVADGITQYNKNKRIKDMLEQQESQKDMDRDLVLRSAQLSRAQTPEQASAIIQKAYEDGIYDDEDIDEIQGFGLDVNALRNWGADILREAGQDGMLPDGMRGSKGSIKGVEGDLIFTDENGNYFSQQTFIDQGGQKTQAVLTDVSGRGAEPIGKLTPVNKMGQTVAQQIKDDASAIEGATGALANQAREVEKGKSLVKQSDAAFKKAQAINNQVQKIDKAIDALNKGAKSGIIQKRLPSFSKATIQLEEAAKELGIEVINSATFGALSAPELQLALDTALPLNLNEDDLLVYLQDKKNAMQKLQGEIIKLGKHLSSGKTMSDWYDKQGASTDDLSDEELINKYM